MAEFDDKVICTKSKIEDVADAIRYKLGETDKYTLDEMPDKVRAIDGGGGTAVIESLSITQNGTYTATGNVDGYSPITVAVEPDLEDVTITQNGTYTSSQHDGFDEVTVNVSTSANLQEKNIFVNGIYTPDSGYDGFSKVTVATTPSLMNRTITENGIYTASQETPVSYDGYGTVIVDVGAPDKLLISDMNFKPTSTWRDDSARSFTLPRTSYSNIAQDDGVGISASGRNANVYPAISFNAGMCYEVEINTGDNSATTTFESYNQLFKLNRTDSHFTLTYGRDIAYDGGTGRWRVSDQSGHNKFLSGGNGNPYYLDNKKITICYGFKYVNGERVANDNKISWYVDDVLELEGTEDLITSGNNTAQLLLFGGNAMLGFVFEDLKVYQHFNVPQPVSLMSASPSESKSSDEKPVEKETVEEKTEEIKEQTKNSVEKASELDV